MNTILVDTPWGRQSLKVPPDASITDVLRQMKQCYSISGSSIVKSTNRSLSSYSSLQEIVHSGILHLQLQIPLLGGKGGFGANLRAKAKKQAKANQSTTYFRDLKTGVTVGDLNRLKLAAEILKDQESKDTEAVIRKREKLQRTIEYYDQILEGKSKDRFENTEFLETADEVMTELRDRMDVVMESDSEESEDSEEEEEESNKDVRPKFTTFFDSDDE